MSWHRVLRGFALGILVAGLAACGSQTPEPAEEAQQPAEETPAAGEPAAEEPAAAAEPGAPMGDAPRVFFTNIEDGGTYTSPLSLEFGVENYEIAPVVEGENPEGVGHFHLAIDVECWPRGEIIPQGEPGYIHFGDGSSSIDVQLEPGEHTLCLQIGDGVHRVPGGEELAGLTQQVTITIEE